MTRRSKRISIAVVLGSLVVPVSRSSRAAPAFDAGYHTITTAGLVDRCLDALGGDRPVMIECDETAGQRWKVTPATGGFHRLTPESSPKRCLDILNDGKSNNQPTLAPCANASGQLWKLSQVGDGQFSLTTSWRGADKCLDIVKDRRANAGLLLADCANTKRQQWKVAAVTKGVGDPPVARSPDRRPAAQPARDPHMNAVDPRSSFEPQFVVYFSKCNLSLRDFDDDYSEERSKGATVACTRTKQKGLLLCKLSPYVQRSLEASRYVFDATMTKDTATALAFAAPSSPLGGIDVSSNPKTRAGTLTVQTRDGTSVTCADGNYLTVREVRQVLKELAREKAEEDRAAASTPSRSEPEPEPERGREPRPTQPKGSARGRMCGKDSDCQSGSCAMENRTRGRCE